jgi:GxxExxY protein
VELEELSHAVIGAAMEVHSQLGPGLLEALYVEALHCELRLRGISAQREVEFPVMYKHLQLGQTLRLDLLVDDRLIVEAKSSDEIHPVHAAQLLTYLKLSDKRLGLLLNFNVASMRQGIKRVANGV